MSTVEDTINFCRQLCDKLGEGEQCVETCIYYQLFVGEWNHTNQLELWEACCDIECLLAEELVGWNYTDCMDFCMSKVGGTDNERDIR